MSTERVCFKFQGSQGSPNIATRTIFVYRAALKEHPHSLLAMLCDNTWKTVATGTTKDPIVTEPLGSLENWLPNMAEMIETYYNKAEYVLPPYVELEEAMSILAYYGLPVQDPKDIELDGTDLQTRLRAKFFLKHYEDHKSAIAAVISEFEKKPHFEKCFVFLPGKYQPLNGDNGFPEDTVFVSSEIPFERGENRERFMEDLLAKGFEARWKKEIKKGRFPQKYKDFDSRHCIDVFSVLVKVPLADPVKKRQEAA